MTSLRTERLILRPWREQDLELFAKLNADRRVMEFFPATLSRAESDQIAIKIQDKITKRGWGFWAVAIPGIADFIGFIGLNDLSFSAHFTPAIEIGWRLDFEYWGKGYATEGAKAALQYGFEILHLNEIVSFTSEKNIRSRHVMEKIGMTHDSRDDFDYPLYPKEQSLRRCVLYRIRKEQCI